MAEKVGFHGKSWKTVETGCEMEIDWHYIDPTTTEGWDHLQTEGHRLADVYTYHAPEIIDRVFAETGFEGFERQQFAKSTYFSATRAITA